MMARFFQWLGADWDHFRALLRISIQIDFRGSWGREGHRRRLSPILRSMIFYVIMGGSLAGSLVSRTTPFLFSLLTLAYSMVMMAFGVILEFGNAIINPDDADVLVHRPIRSRTYFLAKLGNLLFYVLLMGTALCLLPSLLGIWVPGCGWTFPMAFFPMAVVANLATACFVVLIYTGLLRVLHYERFRDVLAYLQMGLAFVIFFSYQFIPRMGREFIQMGTDVSGAWLLITPPAWFAGGVQILLGAQRSIDIQLLLIGVVVTLFLALFSFRRISLQYASQIAEQRTVSGSKKKGTVGGGKVRREGWVGRWVGRLLRSPEAVAGFQLTSKLMQRDRSVKMGIYPVFGIPLAVLLLAVLENELMDPFAHGPFSGQDKVSAVVVFFVFFMIYFFLMGMTYSREWEAAWVYHATPIGSPGRFYRGVKMAILLRLMVPFFVVLGLIYVTRIPPVHCIQHAISLFLFGLVAFSAVSFVVKAYPFSQKRERGERMQRFSFLFFVMPFLGMTILLQTVAYKNNLIWWVTQGGLLILFFVSEKLVVKRLDRILRHKEFFA